MSGPVVEVAPKHCPNGHPLVPGTVVVGWHPCLCVEGHSGHRTYWCRACGTTLYEPPHTPVVAGLSSRLHEDQREG